MRTNIQKIKCVPYRSTFVQSVYTEASPNDFRTRVCPINDARDLIINQMKLEHTWLIMTDGIFQMHDDVIKWKHFPRDWPFVRGIHRSPVNSPHKGQWRGALMCSLICVWINGWINNREAGDFRRHPAHYDVTVMVYFPFRFQRLLITKWRQYSLVVVMTYCRQRYK